MDSTLYIQITLASGLFYSLQLLLSSLHTRFLSLVFGVQAHDPSPLKTPEVTRIPKRLHKPLLYALLKTTPSDSLLIAMFESDTKAKAPLADLEFLKLLYRTVFLTRLSLSPTPFKALVSAIESNAQRSTSRNPSVLVDIAKLRNPSLNTLASDYVLFGEKSKKIKNLIIM